MRFKLVEDWDIKYDPPYNAEQIKANYGEDLYNKLIQDPAHKWRMETGIELIHKEPTKKELDRIWNNWQLMTPEQKRLSDEKSLELFGLSNKENHDNLVSLYEDWDRLEEKTDPSKEIHTHVYADANTSPYKLRGLKSDILKKYEGPLLDLCTEIMNGDRVAAENMFNEIASESRWQTHHINGLHTDSSITDLDNLALVLGHDDITNNNKQLVDDMFRPHSITGISDIDKLIFRLLVVLHAHHVNPSFIFRIPVHQFDVLVNKTLPNETRKNFYTTYTESSPTLIRLCDLKQYMH